MCEEIHQEVDFDEAPERIYRTYMDSKEHSAFSGEPASISPEPGGAFTCWSGQIEGRNIELVPDRRIVQAWRVHAWPEGVYSVVRLEITARGKGTHLVLSHTGIPAGNSASIAQGWPVRYWNRMRQHVDHRGAP
jgi:activator of HSP90 ATPase